MIAENPEEIKKYVHLSLRRQVEAINTILLKECIFEYGTLFCWKQRAGQRYDRRKIQDSLYVEILRGRYISIMDLVLTVGLHNSNPKDLT
jgi:hypothetical protein